MKTLRMIGSGIQGTDHFTQEAITHCQEAHKILLLGSIDGMHAFFLKNKLTYEDISTLYENGVLDSDNYYKIKLKVFAELNEFHDIALIVLGHPRLGVTIVQEFQKETSLQQFKMYVLPGISSFDTMINDLAIDPLEEGTALLDANRLILYDYHMDPCLNYFIYHVSSIGNSRTDYEFPDTNNATDFLQHKLLMHFPKDHKIFLVSSSGKGSEKSILQEGTIDNLTLLLKKVTFDSSLFIPATLPKANRINQPFYNHLMNSSL